MNFNWFGSKKTGEELKKDNDTIPKTETVGTKYSATCTIISARDIQKDKNGK